MVKVNFLNIWLLCILVLGAHRATAQPPKRLSIDSCYEMAGRNYPLIKQYALVAQSGQYSVANVNKGILPQFNIAGQASYQSEVTSLPISIPGMNITPLSKDQYKLYGEVNQPLTTLFTYKTQRDLVNANTEIENQRTEVELYKLKERINNIYFGILLIEKQIEQTQLLKKDITAAISKTETAIANGTALRSSADNLHAEILKADQHIIELQSGLAAYLKILSLFIGETVDEHTQLETPTIRLETATISRPELKLFDLQKNALQVQHELINIKNLPKFSLFLQGGVGRPALNFLNNDFRLYYIGGLRLSWGLGGYYTSNNEKKLIGLNQNALDVQKEVFLFNTKLSLEQQNADVKKARDLIRTDDDIIALRENIKDVTKNQLEYGTATSNDFITAANAADQARQNLQIHRIQLLMAQYNYQTTSGNR